MEEGRRAHATLLLTAHWLTQPQSLSTWRSSRNNEIRSTDKDKGIQQNNKTHFSNFTQQQFSHSSIQSYFFILKPIYNPSLFFLERSLSLLTSEQESETSNSNLKFSTDLDTACLMVY